jgi:hypothetical protein
MELTEAIIIAPVDKTCGHGPQQVSTRCKLSPLGNGTGVAGCDAEVRLKPI